MSSPAASDLFGLAERKLDWLDRRMRLLAGNVANADTPSFRPKDLQPFSEMLSREPIALTRTDPADLAGTDDPSLTRSELAGERSPDGNAVSLEHQLKLVADTNAQQQLTTTLFRKYIGLEMTALGVASSG